MGTGARAGRRWPGMLLVGGAGRNSGKTRLTCALLERFGRRQPLVGLKVTAIRERDGPCPRGKQSCGVCSSLSGDYAITEEHGDPPGKDTALMLASGACRVYWLRVLREHLARGVAALIERIGGETLCICESNSLRHVVEPGLFVIVKARGSQTIKPSCREVLPLADALVQVDAQGFDISCDDFKVVDGGWTLQPQGFSGRFRGARG